MNVLRGENRFGFRGQLTLDFPRMVQTVLRRNSKFKRAIGGFPMITEQTGHSWAKPRERMARMQTASKSRRMRIMFTLNWQMVR